MTAQTPATPAAGRAFGLFDNPYFLLSLTALLWSLNHIVGRAAGGHVPPLALSTLRWTIPSLLLLIFARPLIVRDWPVMRSHWKIMLWLGLIGGALFTSLQYVGLQYTSALNVSVLNSLVPVLIVATSAVLFRDHVTPVQMTGILASSIGIIVIVAQGTLATLLHLSFNWGDILIVINMLMFAIYSVYLRMRPSIHPLSFLFALGALSALFTLPFAISEASAGYTLKLDWLTVGAVGYVGIFPSLVAFFCWNRGIELIGANRAGPFLHLTPVYTAIIATTWLGEQMHVFHIVGFVLILGGVWLASRKGKDTNKAVSGSGTE